MKNLIILFLALSFFACSSENEKAQEQTAEEQSTTKQNIAITPEQKAEAMALYRTGVEYRQNSVPDSAIVFFSKAINIDGKNWQSYLQRGAILRENLLLDLASKDLEKANELNPNEFAILNNLAFLHLSFDDYNKAKSFFENAKILIKGDKNYEQQYTNIENQLERINKILDNQEKIKKVLPQ